MPEQNEQKKPQAPTFNPKVKETIAAFKEDNSPKKSEQYFKRAGALAAAGPCRV